ncbi:hypothetical protein ABUW04_33315 [Streptacidiphilus sp. N1-10]|uniref:DUF4145 domain-containing protein n=1 Tax=Streptacidiphilus jeojiensis TaxID=3229225 RepID=A0ABV6XYU8_9ACTN
MTEQPLIGILDGNTLEELARVICGDDNLLYRQGWELPEFLKRAGWNNVPRYDGEYRRDWILARLQEHRENPQAIQQSIMRLGDAREYLSEPALLPQVLTAVNAFLIHEGYRLECPGGRPRLVACDPAMSYPGSQAPVELRAAMTDIVSDTKMAALLQHRLDEAAVCYSNGAHVSAIIMLGSLLEGVLLTVILQRDPTLLGRTSPDFVTMENLIKICHDAGWLGADVERFSHALRRYRNFVHARAEYREAHTPDRDTLAICWPIVHAALNDLAKA